MKKKNVRSTFGKFQVEVPQDRNSTFEPQIVKKRQKDISDWSSKRHFISKFLYIVENPIPFLLI